jgi:fructose-1,6-bisphosphatase
MPTGGRSTLTQFLIEERRRAPGATGELNALITDVALACKAIARAWPTAPWRRRRVTDRSRQRAG